MAFLILPDRRVIQPQGPVEIDRGNPICKGMVDAFSGASLRSPLSGTVLAGTTTIRAFKGGFSGEYGSSLHGASVAPVVDSTECTFLAVAQPSSTGVATRMIFGYGNSATSNTILAIGQGANNHLRFWARGDANTSQQLDALSADWANTTSAIVVGSRSATRNNHSLYANGRLIANAAYSNVGTVTLDSTAVGGLRRSGSDGLFFLGRVPLSLAWSRALTDNEILEISSNPWQVYRPVQRRIYVDMGAGGGPVTLVTADAAHAQTAGSLTLATTTATSLTVAASAHAQTADALTLTAATALTVASAAHAQTAESLTLTAATGLSLANAAHAQTADPLTLTTASALALDNAAHAQAADNLALSTTGAASLTVASASHAQTTDAPALTSATAIAVNSAAHAQAVDNVLLIVGGIGLAVDSAAHAQTAENIAPSTDSFLVVADASHGQTADLLTLSTASFFAIDGATHTQTADNLSLDGVPALQVGSALHAQAADALALTSDSWLAIDDVAHQQIANNLTLGGSAVPDTGVYPDPATVLHGVQYGPTGADFVGALTVSALTPEQAAQLAALAALLPKVKQDTSLIPALL